MVVHVSDLATGSRRRRADAERSVASILDAAVDLLGERPNASMAEVARAAGVTRQTVYAHFPSREALLAAVADRALRKAVEAIDAADPQGGSPTEALERLTEAWWASVAGHARVLEALRATVPDAHTVHDFHAPILERLVALARRGQRAKEFDRDVSAEWLAAAFLGLMHTAADQVATGRLDERAAGKALARAIPRVFAA
jgi:AcrR family transcriptional regulator